MSTSRRDFMKVFGAGLASLLLTRCRWRPPVASCYTPIPVVYPTPTPIPLDARGRLRLCWLRFDKLAQSTRDESNNGSTSNVLGQQLNSEHRAALDELVASGDLTAPVADLVQEAYDAALYHVWRSNTLITCYEPAVVDYAPTSAQVLVQQSGVLEQLSARGSIDPQTLAKARAALEHDLAYYSLSNTEVQVLYERVVQEAHDQGQRFPSFEELQLEVTPDVRAAAQFLVDLLAEDGERP